MTPWSGSIEVMTAYETKLAKAKQTVDDRRAALMRKAEAAPDHTQAGIPTNPPSGLVALKGALDEATASLEATRAEGNAPT
jgi:hypothetical protein